MTKMLRSELERRVTAFNARLGNVSFQRIDSGGVRQQIGNLGEIWTSNVSADVIGNLENQFKCLDDDLASLEKAVNGLGSLSISCSFSEKKL